MVAQGHQVRQRPGEQAKLDERDPQSVALGYVADSARADAKRFPKHENSQTCSGCSLWQPTPTDALGNCTLFPG